MAGDLTETGALYSPLVGLVYVFNLIVGTGALTMPRAFDAAGWLVSLILVVLLAFMSYLTVTFMVESMACANAMRRWRRVEKLKQDSDGLAVSDELSTDVSGERSPLLNNSAHGYGIHGVENPDVEIRGTEGRKVPQPFDISERIEMGQMASMFFNKVGEKLFYVCMCIYLFGDLAIYAAAVPKSMRDVACTYQKPLINGSHCNESLTDSDPCWDSLDIDRNNAYRIFLAAFTLLLGPFVFFNVQKTKYLQIFTTFMRWISFSMMIVLAVIRLGKGQGEGNPVVADIAGVPTLFGVCVYSFMCHHSLPSLTTPIRDKSNILRLLGADYGLILVFYALLSFTGIFSFSSLQDLYTLNFQPNSCDSDVPITDQVWIQYFLALFPVFTLSTNFPIIAITLRNNLKTMLLKEDHHYPFIVDRITFPLLTIIPPIVVAFITNHVGILVGITGSFAGAAIQYIIPAALVFQARKLAAVTIDTTNQHASPFRHTAWVIFVFIWAVVCISFVAVNYGINGFNT